MKNISLLFAAFILIALSSCKKDTDSNPSGNNDQLKTYTETFTSPPGNQEVVFDVSYDSRGKITGLTSVAGHKLLFTYKDNEFVMDLYVSGQLNIHEIFFLRDGLIDSTLQNNSDGDFTSEKYFYNSNKNLTMLLQYDLSDEPVLYNQTTYTFNARGNMTTSTETDGATTTYEYYEDKTNIIPDVIPAPYKNANLVKKETIDYGGGDIETINLTYTFDSKQRVSTITQVSSEGYSSVQKFTYR